MAGEAMTEIWLGIVLTLGIAFLLLGCVGVIVFVMVKGSEWWLDRRQARRFAEAAARGEFEKAETAAQRAFQSGGTTDLAV
jgi:high-affinity Fe2+/Pb2+ permease